VDVLQRVGQHPVSPVQQLTPRIWKNMFLTTRYGRTCTILAADILPPPRNRLHFFEVPIAQRARVVPADENGITSIGKCIALTLGMLIFLTDGAGVYLIGANVAEPVQSSTSRRLYIRQVDRFLCYSGEDTYRYVWILMLTEPCAYID
jgi:hypothetical protein